MLASARVRLPGGDTETLYAGDMIGRTWSAALRIDDPEISEAHAMLSLRGEQLWLLALRRRFVVEGRTTDAVALSPGQSIRLASQVELQVEAVELPATVLGLRGPGLPAQALPGACSLDFDPHARLVPGFQATAEAHFWMTGSDWRARIGGVDFDLVAGRELVVPSGSFQVVDIALASAGRSATRAGDGPLRIVASFDTVHIHRSDGEVVLIAGKLARVMSELVAVGQPIAWEELARPQWPHIPDRELLRRRWDTLLNRLRDRLREGGLRGDLVSSTRVGLVELVLRVGDLVEDKT